MEQSNTENVVQENSTPQTPETPTPERPKRKSKFALIFVTEKTDGVIKQHVISAAVIEAVAIALFVLFVFIVCRMIYDTITIKDARAKMIEQIGQINDLTDENESLTVENATLTSKITVLSETVSKKVATEDALSQEESENALPKGFPLSGTATMEETSDGDAPMLKFTASSGINVVSTGTGTVLSVDADQQFGNKIIIDHGNGYCSVYRNSGDPLVKTGDSLGKGYILFTIGEDNQELGYQIMQNEEYIDPMSMIEING